MLHSSLQTVNEDDKQVQKQLQSAIGSAKEDLMNFLKVELQSTVKNFVLAELHSTASSSKEPATQRHIGTMTNEKVIRHIGLSCDIPPATYIFLLFYLILDQNFMDGI